MKTAVYYPEAHCPKCGEEEEIIYIGKEEYAGITFYDYRCLKCDYEFGVEDKEE